MRRAWLRQPDPATAGTRPAAQVLLARMFARRRAEAGHALYPVRSPALVIHHVSFTGTTDLLAVPTGMTGSPRGPRLISQPVVLVYPPVAARLAPLLSRALRDAYRRGERVDADTAQTIGDLAVLARAHRAHDLDQPAPSDDGTSERAEVTASLRVVPVMGTQEVAKRLGCTPRNVVDLARRGTLPGQQVGREWTFSPHSWRR